MPKVQFDDEGIVSKSRGGKKLRKFRGNFDAPDRKRDNPRSHHQFRDINEDAFKAVDRK